MNTILSLLLLLFVTFSEQNTAVNIQVECQKKVKQHLDVPFSPRNSLCLARHTSNICATSSGSRISTEFQFPLDGSLEVVNSLEVVAPQFPFQIQEQEETCW